MGNSSDMPSSSLLILGNQLFQKHPLLSKDKPIIMVESYELCTRINYHKFKLVYILTCMRDYRDHLINEGFAVHYYKLNQKQTFESVLKKHQVKTLEYLQPTDKQFRGYLKSVSQKLNIKENISEESPMFLTPNEAFWNYINVKKRPYLMASFYQAQRKRLNIFVNQDGKPYQGKWSFDSDNRKKTPRELELAKRPAYASPHYEEVCDMIDQEFSDNPGTIPDLYIPTNYTDAQKHLQDFLQHHLTTFGDWEDAIDHRDPFLDHSILSPLLNNGLLTPLEVIEALINYCQKNLEILENHYNSVEGLIRQIIGWREWIWGLYNHVYSENTSSYNFFNHQKDLPSYFYFNDLESIDNPPLANTLQKLKKYGYNHHIERLMILSNWMTLSEYNPKQCLTWFSEMYVDAYDWVMIGNVLGMGLFADGGIFATKPYISSSNYLRKMSHYKKGDWGQQWDDKFWDFLFKHEEFFSKNPRMNMLIKNRKKKENTA